MAVPLRVLLAEDSEDDALLLLRELRHGGYEPASRRVETPEAMREALAAPWDIVVSDLVMPNFGGMAALRLVREADPDVPFIMVSGKMGEEAAVEAMRAGAQDYILKSNLSRLVPAIQRELRETEVRRQRRQAEEALNRERAFLSSAIELLPFPISFFSPADGTFRSNAACRELHYGMGCPDWTSVVLLDPRTHMAVPREQYPMMRAMQGEKISSAEWILALPDGTEIPVLMHSAPIYVHDRLVAVVLAFQDISALKAADHAKNQFLGMLSHELRTPLTNILGWVKEAEETPTIIPEALHVIERNAENQRRMLENLLEISRLIHGKLTLRREPTDLWRVTEQAIRDMRPLASERQVELQVEPPPAALPAEADVKRIREAMDNVLDTALRATDPGGLVAVRAERRDGHAVFTVRDTGRGIPPEDLARAFTLFAGVPEEERIGHLQLELPLVKNIVELHGGAVRVDSPGSGKGTTYTIELPLANTA